MRAFFLTSLLVAAVVASPAPAPVVITSTGKPFGVCWETGTTTLTSTIPGATSTIHDPHTTTITTTVYTYPSLTKRADLEARVPEKTTIVVVNPCSETSTVAPWTTTADPHITATTTAYAGTVTSTYTYTLCVEGHMCGR